MEIDFNIKNAKKEDLLKVFDLLNIASKEKVVLKRTKKELELLIKKRNLFIATITENNLEKLVGFVALDFYSRRMSEMRSLYVLKEYRKNGIGKALTSKVFEKAKKLKIKEILMVTIKERKEVFEKIGFFEEAHGFKIALFKKI